MSKWLFVEPSGAATTRLERMFKSNTILASSPALPHLIMFQSAEPEWEAYLKYWGKEYKEIASTPISILGAVL